MGKEERTLNRANVTSPTGFWMTVLKPQIVAILVVWNQKWPYLNKRWSLHGFTLLHHYPDRVRLRTRHTVAVIVNHSVATPSVEAFLFTIREPATNKLTCGGSAGFSSSAAEIWQHKDTVITRCAERHTWWKYKILWAGVIRGTQKPGKYTSPLRPAPLCYSPEVPGTCCGRHFQN